MHADVQTNPAKSVIFKYFIEYAKTYSERVWHLSIVVKKFKTHQYIFCDKERQQRWTMYKKYFLTTIRVGSKKLYLIVCFRPLYLCLFCFLLAFYFVVVADVWWWYLSSWHMMMHNLGYILWVLLLEDL